MSTANQPAASPLSEERVREYEQMLAAVTPGPWTPGGIFFREGGAAIQNVWGPRRSDTDSSGHLVAEKALMADARFIAASPTIVAELLADRTALTARLEAVERERESLLRFAGHALTDARVEDIGDWDGGEMQEALADCGLIARIERPVPCDEDCRCMEFYREGETAECYPITDLGHAAIAAHRAHQDAEGHKR